MPDSERGVLKPACTGKRLLASIGRMSPAAAGRRCDHDCLAGQQLDTPDARRNCATPMENQWTCNNQQTIKGHERTRRRRAPA